MATRRERKPTIYVDSNILSVLCYRGTHTSAVHQHMATKQWWETERSEFGLFASAFTESELSAGTYPGQQEALRLVRRLRYLPFNTNVRQFADELLHERVAPPNKPGDATQLAFATVHRIDYLLTWNYAHLANVHVQKRLNDVCDRNGLRPPLLVSPENIPRAAYGQTLRRQDDP